jgi:uncharacterized membrane protein YfcA
MSILDRAKSRIRERNLRRARPKAMRFDAIGGLAVGILGLLVVPWGFVVVIMVGYYVGLGLRLRWARRQPEWPDLQRRD